MSSPLCGSGISPVTLFSPSLTLITHKKMFETGISLEDKQVCFSQDISGSTKILSLPKTFFKTLDSKREKKTDQFFNFFFFLYQKHPWKVLLGLFEVQLGLSERVEIEKIKWV